MVPAQGDAQLATHASLSPLHFKALYEFGFADIPLGKMGIEISQTADHYAMVSDIVSTGLLKVFVNHSSHTTAEGSGKNFTYPDINYETHYQTKKKKKYARLIYKNGVLAAESVLPPDNRATRPPVSAELKKDATDPLSLILRIRQALFEAQQHKSNHFIIDAYDGRRLTQVSFTVVGKKTITYNDAPTPVILVNLSRKLLAGFTDSELADHNNNEPPLHVYFSDDARLIPLRLEIGLLMGPLTATLAKECATGESCLLGIQD